ncbi:hypothetical protein [Aquibacillus salsiterrae]|uniref:Uncharacterized protein n=1 Tax=Aquibacillus salsiterrae TaxID=2950439 RepID=A0A9X4AF29_9BACI|nr:hypothetical protein [Aquibacillus salsiterrae]MDC3417219.1 hypothetical protein [Aquibacillus salsiterrae]
MVRPHDQHNHHHMYELCKKHIHRYVLVELTDGMKVDGIITGIDNENVYLAVPNLRNEQTDRVYPGYGYPWYGYPGYGYPPGFGYGPGGAFRRLVLPLTALVALSALPWY